MYVKTIAIALLMLAAVVVAQATTTDVINIEKVKESGEKTLKNAKIATLAFNYIALAAMLIASAYVLLVKKRGFPELFGEWWFWVPIALNAVPIILYLLSDLTPLVKAVYEWIKQDQCPFLYCP
jgi:hypothetical protein